MLSVLYVVPPSKNFAGIERVVHDLANGIMAEPSMKIEVTVAYCRDYHISDPVLYKVQNLNLEKLRSLPRALAQLLRREHFDVVVAAQCEASVLTGIALEVARSRAVLIPHLHGNPRIENEKSIANRLLFWFFRRYISRRVPFALAVSRGLATFASDYLNMPGRIFFAPNPLRQSSVQLSKAVAEDANFRFVSVGRLSEQKGHDDLIRAFKLVCDTYPGVSLVIAGEGQAREKLESLIEELKLKNRCKLLGHVPADEALSQGGCFVLASRWEGFGVAIGEALSAGLPVVSTNCDFGPAELIDSSELGIIVPVGDISSLRDAMTTVMKNGYQAHGVKMRQNKAAEYRIERVIREHAVLLRSAVKILVN